MVARGFNLVGALGIILEGRGGGTCDKSSHLDNGTQELNINVPRMFRTSYSFIIGHILYVWNVFSSSFELFLIYRCTIFLQWAGQHSLKMTIIKTIYKKMMFYIHRPCNPQNCTSSIMSICTILVRYAKTLLMIDLFIYWCTYLFIL